MLEQLNISERALAKATSAVLKHGVRSYGGGVVLNEELCEMSVTPFWLHTIDEEYYKGRSCDRRTSAYKKLLY
jgi:hypothetical protein